MIKVMVVAIYNEECYLHAHPSKLETIGNLFGTWICSQSL